MKEFTIYVHTTERNVYKFHVDAETEEEAKKVASSFEVDYAKCEQESLDIQSVETEEP